MSRISKKQFDQALKFMRSNPIVLFCLLIAFVLTTTLLIILQNKTATAPEQTEAQLSQSLQTSLGRSDGLDVKFDPKTGLATVVQTEETEHPEISAQNVRITYSLLVKMGKEMFAIDGVKSLQVTEKVQLNFPKDPEQEFLPPEAQVTKPSEITEVVTITISKTNFNSVNWDDYKGQPLHQLITEKASTYTINPELKAQIKDEELYLETR